MKDANTIALELVALWAEASEKAERAFRTFAGLEPELASEVAQRLRTHGQADLAGQLEDVPPGDVRVARLKTLAGERFEHVWVRAGSPGEASDAAQTADSVRALLVGSADDRVTLRCGTREFGEQVLEQLGENYRWRVTVLAAGRAI